MSKLRVLFIDAYDSFSNNIISLLETELSVLVTKIHIDTHVEDLTALLRPFAAVIAGPGPGNPSNREDVGLIAELWSLSDGIVIPVLGICLGFQSLVHAFGGKATELPRPRHGIETTVSTSGSLIFRDLPQVSSVQYHSLQVTLPDRVLRETGKLARWFGVRRYDPPELIALAWDFSDSTPGAPNEKKANGILMAVKHARRPFYGVQFHPESVCSSPKASTVIKNWWELSLGWLRHYRPQTFLPLSVIIESWKVLGVDHQQYRPRMFVSPRADIASRRAKSAAQISLDNHSQQPSRIFPSSESHRSLSSPPTSSSFASLTNGNPFHHSYKDQCISLGKLDVPRILDMLGLTESEVVVLDSEKRSMPKLGRYSIIGFVDSDTIKLSYHIESKEVETKHRMLVHKEKLGATETIFSYLKSFMEQHKISDGSINVPFWGGLMGYITYEACLETINIPSWWDTSRPDVGFAFVERSIVIDHFQDLLRIQSIRSNDLQWIQETQNILVRGMIIPGISVTTPPEHRPSVSCIKPNEADYARKIQTCQNQIRAGNSYELCLTATTHIKTTPLVGKASSWQRYLKLRDCNPAPFAAYLRLGPLTVLSSSPERFLSWTRPYSLASTVQFRPIKGTVRKHQTTPSGETRRVSLKEATTLLSAPKERAENLMIVDLIRHDLYGVVGSGNVHVRSLMAVEEYASVYQLVSVIEGTLGRLHGETAPASAAGATTAPPSGIDVLAASLPPGSMTGAPKKRSCTLLQGIEDGPRSVYAGVLGYMCVGGGGDFSVVIRTAYKWDDDASEVEEWRIGAGGAITILSDERDEWEEMRAKLQSTLGGFDVRD
ncbi:MAG: hypothetical protein LQ340_005334 [Diploschistes diacapsis]|nr:MAG: hypothetical protein LQ340_005334 [Diploschistes diacapsis]